MWTRISLSTLILWILSSEQYVESTCTQPSSEWSGNWYDSQFDGTFAMTWSGSAITVSGWSVTAYSSTVTSWTCVLEDTTNNYIVFKGDQTVNLFGAPQNAYICMAWTSVSTYSAIYYLRANQETNAGNFRVFIEDSAITMGAASKYCSPSSGPSTAEYHALVKQSYISSVGQYFPTLLLGTYEYTANDGSSSLCGTGSVWDNCADRTITAFNYTQCSTVMAFSSGGTLYNVYSVVSGSYTYVTLVNADTTTDQSTTYRFTCLISEASGSNVQLSLDHGSCSTSGTPSTVPSGGMTALLTPYEPCPFTTTSATTTSITTITTTSATTTTGATSEETSSGSIGLFIGAAIGGLLFILIIIGVIIICLKLKKKKNVVQDEEKKQMPPQVRVFRKDIFDIRRFPECVIETMSPRDALEIGTPDADNRLTPLPIHPAAPEPVTQPDKHPLPPITNNG
ncbi:putative GPI-anchored protein pfl2 isoform X3 [Pecten maximus]|uniref:putative GPI-anchored protein pfl2 isoform X3 n=1 Tax=Pecten maximus TaxID=6579 RepID=UPI0014586E51|nr:putative GPI-anchored protein pfl2 isoform X3 [Pecten maximus]